MKVVESALDMVAGRQADRRQLDVPLDFIPHAPAQQIDGKILAVVDGVADIGQYQVIAINRGHRHGLEPGNVLVTWQRGDKVVDGRGSHLGIPSEFGGVITHHARLPDEKSGIDDGLSDIRPHVLCADVDNRHARCA